MWRDIWDFTISVLVGAGIIILILAVIIIPVAWLSSRADRLDQARCESINMTLFKSGASAFCTDSEHRLYAVPK